MAYPFVLSAGNSYAQIADVQAYFMTYKIEADEYGSARQCINFLVEVTAEIDSVILKRGGMVPPPAQAEILPILQQAAAIGAAAMIEHARYEAGDDSVGAHASMLVTMYDNMLGQLERGDIDLSVMGVQSGGWMVTPDRRQYYKSGNLDVDRTGNAKAPYFTSQQQW